MLDELTVPHTFAVDFGREETKQRMINKRLTWFLESNNQILGFQSGFKTDRSMTDNLVRLETFIRDAFINKERVVAVFFDLEKAYDTTWRYGILKDIHKLGLRDRRLAPLCLTIMTRRKVYLNSLRIAPPIRRRKILCTQNQKKSFFGSFHVILRPKKKLCPAKRARANVSEFDEIHLVPAFGLDAQTITLSCSKKKKNI